MLFHTWPFAIFFAIVYPIYILLRRTRFGIFWLLAACYFFYGWINPLYLILILYSTLLDYFAAAMMERSGRRKLWLSVSIINDIGLLCFFKYSGFVIGNINTLLQTFHIPYEIASPGILLPIGLSFYIFQSVGYMIDLYRGNIEREKSIIRFAAFVSFFPRLLAGPIERAGNLLPQLYSRNKITLQDFTDGLSLFIVGLFKKVALADYLALYVDKIYSNPEQFQSPALLLATFFFCWQIYFDFAGYTDMARGVAGAFGFRLMLNFNNPYLATSLGDFWKRWHISLSSWFKDYLYIPLGGNRRGKLKTYRNIFLTMIISGLWHVGFFTGAVWTFVIWGVVHGLGNCFTRNLERSSFYQEKIPKFVKQLLVFTFVTFTWIFFRANSVTDAGVIVTRIFTSGLADPYCPVLALGMIFSVWLYQFLYESRLKWILESKPVRITIVVVMVFYLAFFTTSGGKDFIYLQF